MLADNDFVGKYLGLSKNNHGDSGYFYTWFLAANIKYCFVIDDYIVVPPKKFL